MPRDISFSDRLFLAGITGPLEPLACRALRKAVHLLGLVLADRLRDLRSADDRILNAAGEIEEQAVLLSLSREVVEILGARWDKVPDSAGRTTGLTSASASFASSISSRSRPRRPPASAESRPARSTAGRPR